MGSHCFFLPAVEPDVLTAGAVPCGRDPFLFPMYRVFMTEQTDEFQITVRALLVKRLLIFFPPNRVHECIRCDGVEEVAVRTAPGDRHPFTFSIDGFVLVQPNRFAAALWAFLFNGLHHRDDFVFPFPSSTSRLCFLKISLDPNKRLQRILKKY